jgi:uncharacterized protein YbaR (Trm112 family)
MTDNAPPEAAAPPEDAPEATAATAPIPGELLDILVCPLTRSPLVQDGGWLIARAPERAGLRYPIRDGIPILLIDEATLPDGVESLDAFKDKYAEHLPDGP